MKTHKQNICSNMKQKICKVNMLMQIKEIYLCAQYVLYLNRHIFKQYLNKLHINYILYP